MINKIKDFSKCILIIISYFFIVIYVRLLLGINTSTSEIKYILAELIVLLIAIVYFRKTLIPKYYEYLKNIKSIFKTSIPYYIGGLLLMIISSNIIGIFVTIPTNEALNREIIYNYPIYAILSMVICAPIIEELITRYTFRKVFTNKYIYIILSSLIFGGLHLIVSESLLECLYIIPYGLLGASLALIYYKTDNIWANISMHAIHNLIAISLLLIGVS